jgi:hypothetical protein
VFAVSGPYADWTGWLDAFSRGETPPADHLVPLDAELGPHVQQRLAERVAAAVFARTDLWSKLLQRDLSHAAGRGATAMESALIEARSRLRPLVALAHNTLLPEELRTQLSDWLRRTLTMTQRDLEDSARRSPVESGRLQTIVRSTSLLTVLDAPQAATGIGVGSPPPAFPGRQQGRRVIL